MCNAILKFCTAFWRWKEDGGRGLAMSFAWRKAGTRSRRCLGRPLGRGTGVDHSALGGGPSRTRWKQLERRGTSCGGWPRTGLNGRSLSVPYAPPAGLRGLSEWVSALRSIDKFGHLNQCCTQFKSPGTKNLCVLNLHDNEAFTFKWYGNPLNKTFYSQKIWIGYNIELAQLVHDKSYFSLVVLPLGYRCHYKHKEQITL